MSLLQKAYQHQSEAIGVQGALVHFVDITDLRKNTKTSSSIFFIIHLPSSNSNTGYQRGERGYKLQNASVDNQIKSNTQS